MTLLADKYVDRIDFLKYLPQTDCGECGALGCQDFVKALKQGIRKPEDCPDIPEGMYYPFQIALDADNLMPAFACLTVPRPGPTGLMEINSTGQDSPILITGNNIHTQDVINAILGTTKSPFFVLFADTKGDTIDMAVILKSFTVEVISREVVRSEVLARTAHREIVIPGLVSAMRDELQAATGCNVMVGPICVGELPLFFGNRWLPPAS